MSEVVQQTIEGGVAVLTLNRPDRLNAWTVEMEQTYFGMLESCAAAEDVRVIVVTGAGRGFCAGADMQDLQDLGADGAQAPAARAERREQTFPLSIPKPIIAAINGACAGIGLVQALMCDMRFAAADAKLTTAFSRRGLVAEHGIAWILPRLVGPARALDLLLSGRVVLGREAAELGLVNRALEPDAVLEHALALRARTGAQLLAREHGDDEAPGLRRPRQRPAGRARGGRPADARVLPRARFRRGRRELRRAPRARRSRRLAASAAGSRRRRTPPTSIVSRPWRCSSGSSTAISTSPSPRLVARLLEADLRPVEAQRWPLARRLTLRPAPVPSARRRPAASATAIVTPARRPGAPRPTCPVHSGPPQRHVPYGLRPVERDDRAAHVGRVQVRARDVGQVDLPHHPHAELGCALARTLEVLEVEQHHVAAVAVVALQVAPGGRARSRGRDDLQKAVAEREHDVGQPERGHAGIAERLSEPEGALADAAATGSSSPATSTA